MSVYVRNAVVLDLRRCLRCVEWIESRQKLWTTGGIEREVKEGERAK